jgi:uncharacterized peroxidase-related enzyme
MIHVVLCEESYMRYSSVSNLPMIEEQDAAGQVALIYADAKRELQLPFIPNAMKVVAGSPAALAIYWNMLRGFYQHSTLPQSLVSMILYTVAERGHCQYCSANHELTCRTLGIDEATLSALAQDLGQVSPQRIRAIIEFAEKAAHAPKSLQAQDFEQVRAEGVTDEELVEIVQVAALGVFSDIMADALKIEVDAVVAQALGR